MAVVITPELMLYRITPFASYQARIQGGGAGAGAHPWDGRTRAESSQGQKAGTLCLLNGCSTPFRHNMTINILKSCKSVFAYVKNRSFPSHIRSSFPWRPPLAEILDPRLLMILSLDGSSDNAWTDAVPHHTLLLLMIGTFHDKSGSRTTSSRTLLLMLLSLDGASNNAWRITVGIA